MYLLCCHFLAVSGNFNTYYYLILLQILKLLQKIAHCQKKSPNDTPIVPPKRKSDTTCNKVRPRTGKFFVKIESVDRYVGNMALFVYLLLFPTFFFLEPILKVFTLPYFFLYLRNYRPSYKDLPCWPTINLDSEPGTSPFVLKPPSAAPKTQVKPEAKVSKEQPASKQAGTQLRGQRAVLRRSPRKRNSPQKQNSPPKKNAATSQPLKKCTTLVFQDKERYLSCQTILNTCL